VIGGAKVAQKKNRLKIFDRCKLLSDETIINKNFGHFYKWFHLQKTAMPLIKKAQPIGWAFFFI
jgi:hypothetical protein